MDDDSPNSFEVDPGDVTRLLHHLGAQDLGASDELITRVYSELRKLASFQLRAERPDHTLQATALVNEAYIRLIHHGQWDSRSHFFRVASKVMRQILVDYARARRTRKRGGDELIVQLDDDSPEPAAPQGLSADDLIALDESLTELGRRDPRQAHIVELRYFGGLSEQEVCDALNIAPRTVRRDWNSARVWLFARLRNSRGSTA